MTRSLTRMGFVALAATALLAPPAATAGRTPTPNHAVVAGTGTIASGFASTTVEIAVFGSINGRAEGFYRVPSAGFEVSVSCLRIEGTRALASGVVTQSRVPSSLGLSASFVLDDRSTDGEPPLDRIILGIANPSLPPTVPCGIAPSRIAGPFDTLVSGDFTINVLPF